MLSGMDMSSAGSWTWLVAVALLVVLAGGGALLALRSRDGRRRRAAGQHGGGPFPGGDDLPGVLESPPGSAGAPAAVPADRPHHAGWPALVGSAPAGSAPAAGASAGRSRPAGVVLGAVIALALTSLLVLAAVLFLDPRPGRSGSDRTGGEHGRETRDQPTAVPAPEPGEGGAGALADESVRPGPDGGAARLTFGGLVLERRAVGITATYPALEVTWNRDEAVAHLRLPTYNCLTAAAPEDPVAAGCLPSVAEYADLSSPALALTSDDGTVQLSGRFPTYVRPNGSPPEWTGRRYEFSLRAAPMAGEPGDGWVRAEGEIRLAEGRASTIEGPEVVVLRRK